MYVNLISIGDFYEDFYLQTRDKYLSTDVAGLQNALFRGSCSISRFSIPGTGVRVMVRISFSLYVAS